jgi:Ca2+-binding RTX toxin-like protein
MTEAMLTQAVADLNNAAEMLPALVVFDSRVDGLDQLMTGLLPGIEAIVLHPHEDGVAQLAALLAERRDLQKLHLVAHGQPGMLFLGAGAINAAALRGVDWRKSFADDAAIGIYGCESGAGAVGTALVAALQVVTGAAVSASAAVVGCGCWPKLAGTWLSRSTRQTYSYTLNWQSVGDTSSFSDNTLNPDIEISSGGVPYLLYNHHFPNHDRVVQKFAGGTWQQLGSTGLNAQSTPYTDLELDNRDIPYLMAYYAYNARVMKFEGGNWQEVGNTTEIVDGKGLTTADLEMSSNGTPYIVYGDTQSGKKAVMRKFENGRWQLVGAQGFSEGEINFVKLGFDSRDIPYVAYQDVADAKNITVKKFENGNWQLVGSRGFASDSIGVQYIDLEFDSNDVPYVSYRQSIMGGAFDKAVVMKFDGTNWVHVGDAASLPANADYPKLSLDNHDIPYLIYKTRPDRKVTVKTLEGDTWVPVGNPSLADVMTTSSGFGTDLEIDGDRYLYATYVAGNNSGKPVLMRSELPLPVVELSVNTANGTEAGTTAVTVTATASKAVIGAQTVKLTVSGTNVTTGDYTLNGTTTDTVTLTIPDQGTTGTATFTVVDDRLYETATAETATLTLSDPSSGVTLGTTITQTIAIQDNDNPLAPPSTPDLTAATDTGRSNTDNITDVSTPTMTGTAVPGTTVTLTSSVDGVIGTVTAALDGTWSITTTPLAEGNHNITATTRDGFGNVSAASAALAFTLDTIAPAAPVIASTGTVGATLTGTAEANSTVELFRNDGTGTWVSLGTVTTNGAGQWSMTPAPALADGDYQFKAAATDAAGNTSGDSAIANLTVDMTPPTTPTIAGDALTKDSTPDLTGTAEANSTVQILKDDGTGTFTEVATVTADGDGNWSYTPAAALADGNHRYQASSRDAVGNTATSTTLAIAVDATAPPKPTITSTGTIGDTLTGTAEANSTVELFRNDGTGTWVSLGTVTADGAGNWSKAHTLSDGDYQLKATATDAAQNTSPDSDVVNLTLDTTAPTAPTITAPKSTNDTTPTITGTAEANSTVEILKDDGTGTFSVVGTATADGNGKWQFEPTAALAEGSHRYQASSRDPVGNTATSRAIDIQVDLTRPSSPTILSHGTIAGPLAGTAEPGSTVEVLQDDGSGVFSVLGSAIADETGNWSLAVAVGSYVLKASAVDAAGNASGESEIVEVTVRGAVNAPIPVTKPIVNVEAIEGAEIPDGQIPLVAFAPNQITEKASTTTGTTGRMFRVFNRGTANLEILELNFPPGFALAGVSRRTIPPGQAALLEVSFNGSQPGLYTGNLVMYTNDPERPFYNFPLESLVTDNSIPLPTPATAQANLVQPTLINGSNSDDQILGNKGSQVLSGLGGNDAINGNQGEDVVDGGDGDDILSGGQGDDVLFGGAGNDILAGDFGSDALIGGAGADIFVLGETRGIDTIYDFVTGEDRIALEPVLTFGDLSLSKLNGNLQIFAGAKQLAIVLNTTTLSASDFATL